MKKIIYSTIFLFIAIMVLVIVIASRHPVVTVKYEDGVVVEETE